MLIGSGLRRRVFGAISPQASETGATMAKQERDIDREYPLAEFIEKLRRLADSLETGKRFDIQIDGERIYVPARATYTIEHERNADEEEIEFQIKWSHAEDEDEAADEE
jgi:amphi-Trp domain-containing protein